MAKDDRSTHITGPVTNSPTSSGEFHGPVEYNYSRPIININVSSKDFESVQQIKRTPDEEFQIQGSSDGGGENITNRQSRKAIGAAIQILSDGDRSSF